MKLFQLFIAAVVSAQTLDEAWIKTQEHSPEIRSLLETRAVLDAAEEAAWRDFFPGINLGAGLNRSGPLFSEAPGSASTEGDNWSFRTSLDLQWRWPWSADTNRLLRDNAMAAWVLSLQTARAALWVELQKTWLSALTASMRVNLQTESLRLARERYASVRARYQEGLSSEWELLTAEVNVRKAEPLLSRAQADLNAAQRQLALLTGDSQTVWETENVWPEPVLTRQPALADAEASPGALKAKWEWQRLELTSLSRRDSEYLPSISLSAGTGVSAGKLFSGAPTVSDSFSLGISVSLPLDAFLPGNDSASGLLETESAAAKAKIAYEEAVAEALENYIRQAENLAFLELQSRASDAVSSLQARRLAASEELYLKGELSLSGLESARTETMDAQIAALEARQAWLTAAIEFAAAAPGLVEAPLLQVPSDGEEQRDEND